MNKEVTTTVMFQRAERLLGREAMEHLGQQRVIIFGVGGVGSWCAETPAQKHTKGIGVSFVIPETAADRLYLRLDSPDGYSNEYELLIKN